MKKKPVADSKKPVKLPGGAIFQLQRTAKLTPYARNPRKNDGAVSPVAKSIEEFGFRSPIEVDGDGQIVAGHTRLKAAIERGDEFVPVITWPDLHGHKSNAYRIASNKTGEIADWDEALLSELLIEILESNESIDLDAIGFDDKELKELLRGPTELLQIEENTVPEPPKKPITKSGDLWVLGEHRVLCGDALKVKDVARLFGNEHLYFSFTSPPYLDIRTYEGKEAVAPIDLATFMSVAADKVEVFCVNLGLIHRDGKVIQYWDEYITHAKYIGLDLCAWNVWSKGGSRSLGVQLSAFPCEHEWLFVFASETPHTTKSVKTKSKGKKIVGGIRDRDGTMRRNVQRPVPAWKTMGSVSSIHADTGTTGINHPARFPIGLPAAYIQAFDSDVYDPFLGSGTTLIAAEQLNRRCFGMEIEPAYCDVIVQRWENLTGQKAKKE